MWYVFQVKTGDEFEVTNIVKDNLLKSGEDAFVPMYKCEKIYHGTVEERLQRLFPGYIFIDTPDISDMRIRMYMLHSVDLYAKIIKTGDEMVPVSESEREMIENISGPDHIVDMSRGIIEHDKVRIFSGPLADYTGEIIKIDRHKRLAWINLDLKGKTISTKLGLEIIEKIR